MLPVLIRYGVDNGIAADLIGVAMSVALVPRDGNTRSWRDGSSCRREKSSESVSGIIAPAGTNSAMRSSGAATSIVVVGVLGFLAMLVGTFLVVTTLRVGPDTEAPAAGTPAAKPGKAAKAPKTGFMDRVEERFRKRREGDDS